MLGSLANDSLDKMSGNPIDSDLMAQINGAASVLKSGHQG
jgi:hypothetical protein